MRKLRMTALVLATMALLPAIASATHFTDIVVGADCEGWWAQAEVYWRSSSFVGDLNYSIGLVDEDATILEQIDWAGQISRELDDPQFMVYNFAGSWSGTFNGPHFGVVSMFHLVAPWDGGVDDETANYTTEFDCTVATENSTWSTIKALYQ